MKKLILFVAIFVSSVLGITYSTHPETAVSNCTDQVQLDKLIDDRKLVTLVQSITTTGKINETMITPLFDRETIIVEYDPEIEKDHRKYCVISITKGTKANDYTIELLYNASERVKGHRA